MKRIFLIVLVSLMIVKTISLKAQEKNGATLGVGTGLEFGGIGGKLAYYPTAYLGFFGGVGFILSGAGYNVGLQLLLPTESKVKFYLEGLYGYNAIICVQEFFRDGAFKETYYGYSLGTGVNIKNPKENYWQISFLIPFRSQEFKDTLDYLAGVPQIKSSLPFTFTVGFNLNLK